MAKVKLSLEDSIFFYFSSAPLPEAQEQYKKIRGILAHRTRSLTPRRKQTKRTTPAYISTHSQTTETVGVA